MEILSLNVISPRYLSAYLCKCCPSLTVIFDVFALFGVI